MKIAITGGIGSGKSYICKRLSDRGIEVYDCDAAAKRLMRISSLLQQKLSSLVGADIFANGMLQKAILAKFILESDSNKSAVNDIVHPAVADDFEKSGYDWLESAILFESGFDKRSHFDKIICVTAPLQVRVNRVMLRDNISEDKALDWINNQLAQEEKVRRSDYEIINDGECDLDKQIDIILKEIKY